MTAIRPKTIGRPAASPAALDDHAVDGDPQRADPEREREVQRERGVPDRRRGDVGEQRLELRALGEAEEAHEQDADPQPDERLEPASTNTTKPTAPPR